MSESPHDYCVDQFARAYEALKNGNARNAQAYIRGALLQLTGRTPEGYEVLPVVEIEVAPASESGSLPGGSR